MRISRSLLGIFLALAASSAAAQNTPADVRDLVGARGSSGEAQLAARGYVNVGGQQGDDTSWTYWWNDRRGVCLSVATSNGRYQSIVTTPAPDCRRGGGQAQRPPSRPEFGGGYRPGYGGPPGSGEEHITLVCYGEGRRPVVESRPGYEWDNNKDHYVPKNRMELSSQNFDATVMVEFWGNTGRIRPARSLIPPINAGGDGGWWPLTDVSVGRDRITAQFRFSALNKPRVQVDRRSGRISVENGQAGFRGNCDTVDERDHRRF
ncbi:hypothetical protein [Phenylobacterium deserti]|uniref:Uncharacterized protein n=1 Tax=Phenylobacterium deserti TaxID=1914756 RepID=A0A328AD51_9CAUL|nr:hypothetical protein [Phenylobacterium deserti]RAK52692.1 hypothetical protein DJ018_10880 [Phenylobacterium deserti]